MKFYFFVFPLSIIACFQFYCMEKQSQFLNPLLEEDNLKKYYQMRNDQMKENNKSTIRQPSTTHNKNLQNQAKNNSNFKKNHN